MKPARFSKQTVLDRLYQSWKGDVRTFEDLTAQPYREDVGSAQLPTDAAGVVPREVAILYGQIKGVEELIDWMEEEGWR